MRVLTPLLIFIFSSCNTLRPEVYEGPPSDHFNGETFSNPWRKETKEKGLIEFLRWQNTRKEQKWPEFVEIEPGLAPEPVVKKGIKVTYVGHATVLIQVAGLNILTDPVWSDHVGPVVFRSHRHKPPGIRFEDLPPIDAVLLSHNHYDHMDLPTLRRLEAEKKARPDLIFAGLGNKKFLEANGLQSAFDLDWWQEKDLGRGVSILGVPAQHWSLRWLGDRNRTLWLGYVIKTPQGKIFFAGDTGMGPHFKSIRDKVGAVDLSLLPIGAYSPKWFMEAQHISPEQAVEVHQLMGSHTSVAIHFETFKQSDEAWGQAERDLNAELERRRLPKEQFQVLEVGHSLDLPRRESKRLIGSR